MLCAGGYSHLVDDLSDDDEGRFPTCQRGGCRPKRPLSDMGVQLAGKAVAYVGHK